MFLKSGRVSYGGMITAAMVVLLYLFGLTAVLLAEVVWIAFDRAYAVFRIKWSQWMHRAGADGSSRL